MGTCAFCTLIEAGDAEWSNDEAVAFRDQFPISPGHALVVPRLHESNLFELGAPVRAAMWAVVDVVQRDLSVSLAPDGFNIGVNVGPAAGQTVDHAHIHVIPRYIGDVDDPRGGVRWVVPGRAGVLGSRGIAAGQACTTG